MSTRARSSPAPSSTGCSTWSASSACWPPVRAADRSHLRLDEPAVDGQRNAGDVARGRRAEEDGGARELGYVAEAAQRDHPCLLGDGLLHVRTRTALPGERLGASGADAARQDGVDAYAGRQQIGRASYRER